jgi:hypothetical protein
MGSKIGRKLELGRLAPLATRAMRPWWRVKTSREYKKFNKKFMKKN